jgi:hypothetical protein
MNRKQIVVVSKVLQSPPLSIDLIRADKRININNLYKSGDVII